MKTFFITLISVCCTVATFAQAPLTLGDQLPDLEITGVSNYKNNKINLTEFKDKLIILVFWSTRCAACLKSFPELENLQQQFNNRLQIILVTSQSQKSLDSFFSIRKKIKLPGLPLLASDTILSSLFPYKAVPHYIWIAPGSQVKYITDGTHLTAKNIQQALNQQSLDLKVKTIVVKKLLEDPLHLLKLDASGSSHTSILAKCSDSFKLRSGIDTSSAHVSISFDCSTPINLLKAAFEENKKYNFFYHNTVSIETPDSLNWYYPSDKEKIAGWRRENLYNYFLRIPSSAKPELFQHMQKDLQRLFNVKVTVENRMVKSIALVITSDQDKLRTKGGEPKNSFISRDLDTIRYLQNKDFGFLTQRLRWIIEGGEKPIPFVDETNYKGLIDIKLTTFALYEGDLLRLRKELNSYNLDLIGKEILRPVLVITSK